MNLSIQKPPRFARFLCVFFFVLSFFVGGGLLSLAPQTAHAQIANPTPVDGVITTSAIENACTTSYGQGPGASNEKVEACIANTTAVFQNDETVEIKDDSGRSLRDIIGDTIGTVILEIAAFFTWLGGILLDWAVNALILDMGALIENGGTVLEVGALGDVIDTTWTIIRDFANLAFIFGFVWIGIRTIIDYQSAGTKRFLASLIIAALLINFSLLIAKVVIDVSNVVAVEVYDVLTDGLPEIADGGIAAALMHQMGLMSVYESGTLTDVISQGTDYGFAFYVMAALFLLIAAYVFAAGAILVIIRFVALVLIMIFSPVLFAATVFPATRAYATQLWSKLFGYAFFAPVFFLFILISYRIIGGFGNSERSFAETLSNKSSPEVILVFFIIIIFMVFSLLASKQLAGGAGAKAVQVGGNLRRWGQGVVGRSTVGAGSYGLRRGYDSVDARMQKSRTGRNIRRFANVASLGATSDRALRSTLRKGETAKFGSSTSFEDQQKGNKETASRRGNIQAQQDFEKTYKEGTDPNATGEQKVRLERAVANASTKMLEGLSAKQLQKISHMLTSGQIESLEKSDKFNESQVSEIRGARRNAIQSIYEQNRDDISKASVDQLESVGSEYLKQEQNAVMLNSSQMDDLKKKFTQTEFRELSETRENALKKLAGGETITVTDERGKTTKDIEHILKRKPGELSKLPASVLKERRVAERLPVNVLSKITTDGALENTDQAVVRKHLENLVNTRSGNISEAEDKRLSDIDDWLKSSPVGKQFGK